MPNFRDGQQNIAGIVNPGVYIDVVPPTPYVAGVPTNVEGYVGVGSWGPLNAISRASGPDGVVAAVGPPQFRSFDLASHVLAGMSLGNRMAAAMVRVSDGTDTAASFTDSNGTWTAKYSGVYGNQIKISYQGTAQQGAYAAVVNFPGRSPERYDNIQQGLQSVTVVAGTGYTSVPAAVVSPPQTLIGGIQAAVQATLKAITATLGAGGAGYVVGDKITLSNGVVLTVATVTSGAVATTTIFSAGAVTSGSVPANPVAQVSTTGSGTGATFTLTYGLGTPIITSGAGYTAAPTITLTGGGGTGGTYTGVASFWAALAYAVNNGTPQRGASNVAIFTPASSTATPTVGTTQVTLTGGTDGANGVGTQQLVGLDYLPRTGLYALRSAGVDGFCLCGCVDTASWGAMLSFSVTENAYAVMDRPISDTIAAAAAARNTAGIDDYAAKILVGDYPTYYDATLGVSRLIAPSAFALGLFGNLSPEQSSINKPLQGLSTTQTAMMGILTADADEAVAQTAGIDFIGKSAALGTGYFSFMTGRNASSNSTASGDEYTRLTNFLVRSLEGPALKTVIGRLQSLARPDDPTRQLAKALLDGFFAGLKDPASGSGGYGIIDDYANFCGLNENPPALIVQGFLVAISKVRYLNVVRYFLVKLNGGGNVDVKVSTFLPVVTAS